MNARFYNSLEVSTSLLSRGKVLLGTGIRLPKKTIFESLQGVSYIVVRSNKMSAKKFKRGL